MSDLTATKQYKKYSYKITHVLKFLIFIIFFNMPVVIVEDTVDTQQLACSIFFLTAVIQSMSTILST